MSFPVIRPEDVESLPEPALTALRRALRYECQEAAARHQALVFARRRAARNRPRPPVPVDPPEVIAARVAVLLAEDGDHRITRDDIPESHLVGGVWRWDVA
jgi:hypothetical protein